MNSRIPSRVRVRNGNTISTSLLERWSVGWSYRPSMERWSPDAILSEGFSSRNRLPERSSDEWSPLRSINTSMISIHRLEYSSSLGSSSESSSGDSEPSLQECATSPTDFRPHSHGGWISETESRDIRRWSMRWCFSRYFLWFFVSDYTLGNGLGGYSMDSMSSFSSISSIVSPSDSSSPIVLGGSDSQRIRLFQYLWEYTDISCWESSGIQYTSL